jgi:hypothetical protein
MRIRQVKPSFFTDGTMAGVSYAARLFYIGLWCVADDAGWLRWDPMEIGAVLYPYDPPRRRLAHIQAWAQELVDTERVVLLDCGCAHVRHLEKHQKHAGGSRSYAAREAHDRHRSRTSTDESVPVQISSAGKVRNGKESNGSATRDVSDNDAEASEFKRLVPRPGTAATGVH